jgi:diguanylate cyclase (GGDEF)-like protein
MTGDLPRQSSLPAEPASIGLSVRLALWVIVLLALLIVGTVGAGGLFGFQLAQQADDARDARHREALRAAVAALACDRDGASAESVNTDILNIIGQAAGIRDLRFDAEPAGAGRAVQSVVDRNGRIAGWLSWQPDRPVTALLLRLLPFCLCAAVAALAFLGLALWQIGRLGRQASDRARQLAQLLHEDPLTGLPNRRKMIEALDATLRQRRPAECVAFAVIDLYGIDELRQAIGDAGVDTALIEISDRLRRAMPPDTMIGRFGRGKFSLILRGAEPDTAYAAVAAARDIISRAVWVNHVVQVAASAGLALAPRDATGMVELVRVTRLALRSAERKGRNVVMPFQAAMETDYDQWRFIRSELSIALAAGSLDVHYQPVVTADGGRIIGVEALLRWNHPTKGFIPPQVFVRVAEDVGLMDQLGEFVLRRALTDAMRWPDVFVAVNLSPVQVRDRKLVTLVSGILAETGIRPSRVVMEITESVLIDDPETANVRLEDLRALGVKLALDDFGAGYSSLAYLQRLPFDKLKIDRAFVVALDTSANTGVIIQAIVALGRAIGLTVVVEGVETEEQRILLRLAGCDEMQGFLFAKAQPREQIDALLKIENPRAADARPDAKNVP